MTTLIPLEKWATDRFPVSTPHIQTVRRWARAGKIHPTPKKHGRAYYVAADAEYLTDADLVERLRGTATSKPR